MASDQQAPLEAQAIPLSKYSKRVILKTILGRPDGGLGLTGQRVVVGGWVKSSRELRITQEVAEPTESCLEAFNAKLNFFQSILKVFIEEHRVSDKLDAPKTPQRSISILQVSDGSCVSSLQVSVESHLGPPSQVMPTGTCILAEGILLKPSLQGKATMELKADKILHIGLVENDSYPLSKKNLPLELLRDSAHFRPRTTMVASVMRIRSALTRAIHTFFQENGFLHVQVPIITTTECEGLGKNFQVTTLLGKEELENQKMAVNTELELVKASLTEKSKIFEKLKRSTSDKEAIAAALQDLRKTNALASELEARQKEESRKIKIDFSQDFFSCRTYLTDSGRLHLESFASALGNVYSFGPRFHANKSNSKKSLAEMWILELEMAFSQLEDSMECASDFLKFICKWLLENCEEDLNFVSKRINKLVVDHLQLIATDSFEKISYTEAVEVLERVTEKKFEKEVQWGSPLSEEHESYLIDEVYKKPLIIYNHPREFKPFYVRSNGDGETSASFHVIVPKVGTLIRGSQNEERLNMLSARIEELLLEKQQYEWYLDLHRHGTATCSGFSFFFDPLILYATGLNDARDVVPFPRS